jgi:hypothetical protein
LPCRPGWWDPFRCSEKGRRPQLCHGCHLRLRPRPDGYSRNARNKAVPNR